MDPEKRGLVASSCLIEVPIAAVPFPHSFRYYTNSLEAEGVQTQTLLPHDLSRLLRHGSHLSVLWMSRVILLARDRMEGRSGRKRGSWLVRGFLAALEQMVSS